MMKISVRRCAGMLLAVLLAVSVLAFAPGAVSAETSDKTATDSEILPSELYARYAVLMDAGTGRVLFSKSGDTEAPMASTTKIMTCILALEIGNLSDEVSVSDTAVS